MLKEQCFVVARKYSGPEKFHYAGEYKEHYRIIKGGSDPVLLFGPQAERKGGLAPALLTYSPASRFWHFLLTFRSFARELALSGIENRPENIAENRFQDGSLRNCEPAAGSLFVLSGMDAGKP